MTKAVAKPTKSIRDLINSDQMKRQFELALPSVCTPERFVRVALTTINKNPSIARCTQESLLGCLMDCASLGIEPDGRRAHIIPYGDKATLIIDYKGLIELARRSGEVSNWRAELVCDNDEFTYRNGKVTHEVNFREPRGNVYAVYSECVFKDGTIDYEVMTLEEVEAIRKRSKSGNAGPWKTDFNEMAKKSVIRRHSKRLPLSAEFRDAVEKDQDVLIEDMKPASGVVSERVSMFGGKAPEVPEEPEPDTKQDEGEDEIPMDDPPDEEEVSVMDIVKALDAYGGKSKANLKSLGVACNDFGVDMNDLESADPDVLKQIADALGVS